MTSGKTPEELFLDNLDLVERVIAFVRRRCGMSEDEGEEFGAEVRLKLVDDGYAVLRKFEGKSSLATYLTVVVQRLALDYRIARWGKWRPSAAARREGTVGVRLERLLVRDGLGFDEACEILRRNHGVKRSAEELAEVAGRLPARVSRRFEGEEALETTPAAGPGPHEALAAAEREKDRRRLGAAVRECLATLSPEDRLILRLRFGDGLKVVDVARCLALDQKPLYRRIDRLRGELRRQLESRGIRRSQVEETLRGDGGEEWSLWEDARGGENHLPRPSPRVERSGQRDRVS